MERQRMHIEVWWKFFLKNDTLRIKKREMDRLKMMSRSSSMLKYKCS
jgi:hypothetical protein